MLALYITKRRGVSHGHAPAILHPPPASRVPLSLLSPPSALALPAQYEFLSQVRSRIVVDPSLTRTDLQTPGRTVQVVRRRRVCCAPRRAFLPPPTITVPACPGHAWWLSGDASTVDAGQYSATVSLY